MGQLYFRQLLAGRDFGQSHPVAGQMQNFIYLIGDSESRECVVVDPAWAVGDIVEYCEDEEMKLVGALATHYHPDHVGGEIFGLEIEGIAALIEKNPLKLHCHKLEAEGIRKVTGLDESDLVRHDSGDKIKVGDIEIELLHTPGHTPGSICFRLKDSIVAGDTLFLQGCGRVDLPGGDSDEMYRTLTQRLSTLPGSCILYPGHAYGGEHAPMDEVRKTNQYLQIPNVETWRQYMG